LDEEIAALRRKRNALANRKMKLRAAAANPTLITQVELDIAEVNKTLRAKVLHQRFMLTNSHRTKAGQLHEDFMKIRTQLDETWSAMRSLHEDAVATLEEEGEEEE
jgi:hypothetical protein